MLQAYVAQMDSQIVGILIVKDEQVESPVKHQ